MYQIKAKKILQNYVKDSTKLLKCLGTPLKMSIDYL